VSWVSAQIKTIGVEKNISLFPLSLISKTSFVPKWKCTILIGNQKMNFIRTTFKSHLPPSMSTYGKSKPLSRAQEQDLGFVHFPLQSHPEALGGMITFLATWTDLIYLKPIISKLNHWQRQHR